MTSKSLFNFPLSEFYLRTLSQCESNASSRIPTKGSIPLKKKNFFKIIIMIKKKEVQKKVFRVAEDAAMAAAFFHDALS